MRHESPSWLLSSSLAYHQSEHITKRAPRLLANTTTVLAWPSCLWDGYSISKKSWRPFGDMFTLVSILISGSTEPGLEWPHVGTSSRNHSECSSWIHACDKSPIASQAPLPAIANWGSNLCHASLTIASDFAIDHHPRILC